MLSEKDKNFLDALQRPSRIRLNYACDEKPKQIRGTLVGLNTEFMSIQFENEQDLDFIINASEPVEIIIST